MSRSIHIAANSIISFFFMAEQYSIVYIYHIFFIHLSMCLKVWYRGVMWSGLHLRKITLMDLPVSTQKPVSTMISGEMKEAFP